MNALDIGLVIVVAAFAVYGAVKGLVRLALGSVAIGSGVFLACWYHAPVEAMLAGWIHDGEVRVFLAFGGIFLATIVAFAILIWFITKTLEAVNLRWIDRLSGALVGLAIATLLIGAALVPLIAFLPPDSTLVSGSRISPYILHVSAFVKSVVPEGLKKRYEEARARMAAAGKGALPGGGTIPVPPGVPEVLTGIEKLRPAATAKSARRDPNS